MIQSEASGESKQLFNEATKKHRDREDRPGKTQSHLH